MRPNPTDSVGRPVGGSAPVAAPKPPPAGATVALGLADLHWQQAVAAIADLKTPEAVSAALAEERGGKGRSSVIEAAERGEALKSLLETFNPWCSYAPGEVERRMKRGFRAIGLDGEEGDG